MAFWQPARPLRTDSWRWRREVIVAARADMDLERDGSSAMGTSVQGRVRCFLALGESPESATKPLQAERDGCAKTDPCTHAAATTGSDRVLSLVTTGIGRRGSGAG
jgi:hypothetical protein